ncbi:EI24 domain-containing protein [Bernardetia sp.]|uniref:EI24 domain-containing protein n=1 Tax=Bernardetia sp. TaxID=1937974 RepID=UPI0025C24530|nr:EI24 domain-containing protein [Bernardetia sp.]
MNPFKKFLLGVRLYGKAFSFTKEHNLWKYHLLPAFLNLVIFLSVGVLGYYFVGDTIDWLESLVGLENPENWWQKGLSYLVIFLVSVASVLIYLKLYKYLMLILLAPALSIVAAKVQEILHPDRPNEEFQFPQFVSDLKRGLTISLTNLAIELGITIPLILLGIFVSFLSPFTTIIVILVESYFLGFGMIDLRNEFMKLGVKESRETVKKHRPFAVGVGLTMYLMILIPVLGILFAPIWACISAGLGIYELEEGSVTEV